MSNKKFNPITFTPQPMETAPKDRTIQIFTPISGWILGCWVSSENDWCGWYGEFGTIRATAWADIPAPEEEE